MAQALVRPPEMLQLRVLRADAGLWTLGMDRLKEPCGNALWRVAWAMLQGNVARITIDNAGSRGRRIPAT